MNFRENRLIDVVEELNSLDIRDWEGIIKFINKKFDCKVRFNRIEAEYITAYFKGNLNFNSKVIDIKKGNNYEQ